MKIDKGIKREQWRKHFRGQFIRKNKGKESRNEKKESKMKKKKRTKKV